ncbi:MAG: phage baseplate assembly protein V [Clostridiaceae bacterium]
MSDVSGAVYTYGDIIVEPYKFEKVIKLKITSELNEHSKLVISGILPEEKMDEYVENASGNEVITVSIKKGEGKSIIFTGMVTNILVEASMDVRSLTVEALSITYKMDIKKKKRSFQNKSTLYSGIFNKITGEYANSQAIDEASKGANIGGLLVQYNETDWEFIKRLASHFNAPLVPAPKVPGVKYYIGVPNQQDKVNLEEFNYSIKKDLKGYRVKSENDITYLSEQNLVSYVITSNKILDLCSIVIFKGRNLYVYRCEINMDNGVLLNKYILRDFKGLSRRKILNYGISGASLFGHILDVSKDRVKVSLDIDKGGAPGTMWFPYSTVYSSPDGSGWYCMPEVGDKIRLYFPNENEKKAFVVSSVNMNSSDSTKRCDPSVKSIATKYGKQIVFQPGAVEIVANGNLLVRLSDDGGIEINSDKKIVLDAKEDIEINSKTKIILQGEEEVKLTQASANMTIKDDVTISGEKVKMQ